MEVRKIKLTDEDKQLVLERYSDIEWLDDVTHMRCTLCQNIAIHICVLNCQHLICRACYVNRGPNQCQKCGEAVTKLSLWDVEIESKLCQLKVCCPNKKYGCQHVDELGDIVDHVKCCSNSTNTTIPVEPTETYTMEALYRHVSEQLRHLSDEMRVTKSESEANWELIKSKMTELGQKVDNNMDQLTKNLHALTGKLINYEIEPKGEDARSHQIQYKVDTMELNVGTLRQKDKPTRIESKEKDPGRKKIQNLKQLRDEVDKVKSEQTRLASKAKEDMETIFTVKGRADAFVQLLEQKEKKTKKKQKKIEIDLKSMLDLFDVHKEQLEDVKTRVASMNEEQKTTQVAMGLLESSITELSKDLQKQHKQLTTLEQHQKEKRNREVEQLAMNKPDLMQKPLEPTKIQMLEDDNDFGLWTGNPILPPIVNPVRTSTPTRKQRRGLPAGIRQYHEGF